MREVLVGLGSCGLAAGGLKVYEKFAELISSGESGGPAAVLKKTGCIGMCHAEVLVEIRDETHGSVFYGNVSPEKAAAIFESHIKNGRIAEEFKFDAAAAAGKQKRIALRNSGVIDPDNIDEYIARQGYKALEKALTEMTPADVVTTVSASGLRGRGGAGFSTGTKWKFAAASKGDHKYVICNADEGDPGAFMDRSLLESDPHSILEGMAIAAYAIGADAGYIYVRAEYPEAIRHLKLAISEATKRGFLGDNIFGKGFKFNIRLKEGAGAFVCGEETALIASIEGKRGMPRVRPPFPVESGLWGYPTSINNVETFANVAWIILNGPGAFSMLGTEGSKGTKVFALAGKIKNGGLVEVPMGMTLNEVIYEIGGGTTLGGPFKAVQMGGPSGGCIPTNLGGTPVDYEQITATGAIMGSGGMVVMDETTCMVDVARFFLSFTQNESCGKCTFCRIGTKRMLEILERICAGKGKEEDIPVLQDLGEQIKASSLCGLGQSAPNPVLTTLRYFMDEYTAHIRDKKCPAKSCLALVEFVIEAEKCTGCGLCIKSCAVGAITGEKKQPHTVDDAKCVRCGKCMTVCNFNAIVKQ
jgi:NADH-quinone oxidoreductase subunit F